MTIQWKHAGPGLCAQPAPQLLAEPKSLLRRAQGLALTVNLAEQARRVRVFKACVPTGRRYWFNSSRSSNALLRRSYSCAGRDLDGRRRARLSRVPHAEPSAGLRQSDRGSARKERLTLRVIGVLGDAVGQGHFVLLSLAFSVTETVGRVGMSPASHMGPP